MIRLSLDRVLGKLAGFFLGLHYIAFIYAFVLIPLTAGGGAYSVFGYLYVLLIAFIPIGPLPLCMHIVMLLVRLLQCYMGYAFLIATAIIAFKCVMYFLLRRYRVYGFSAVFVAASATFIIFLFTVGAAAMVGGPPEFIVRVVITYSLISTIPIELTLFSYVKYRDAVNGRAPKIWVPSLTILWVTVLWLSMIYYAFKPPTIYGIYNVLFQPVTVSIWVAISIIQVLFSILYYVRS